MTRNHMLKLSLQPRSTPSVWRMTLDLIGQAFGAPSPQDRGRGR
ncbi:hypothetical protein [Brevundimonas sp.]|nr:hypothetical protein [Brevundimonas sp.]